MFSCHLTLLYSRPMKRILLTFSFILFLFSSTISLFSFKQEPSSIVGFKQLYVKYTSDFSSKFLKLEQSILMLDDNKASIDSLITDFREVRYAYKKVELILEYYAPRMALDINSPLVIKPDEYDKEKIRYPEGLQVLEEYVYGERPFDDKATMIVEVGRTKPLLINMQLAAEMFTTSEAHIFEMARFHLVRIVSLGINGFDATISLDGLKETAYALDAIDETVQVFKGSSNKNVTVLLSKIHKTIVDAKKNLLVTNDFNRFDRLYFIKKFAIPISNDVFTLQQVLGIERLKFITALDLSKKNIFEKEAFAVDFFSQNQRDTARRVEKIALGQVLFFDPILSENNKRSCASCHMPDKAFTDGRAKSLAFDFKGDLERNAPTLLNVALQRKFFHDGRSSLMESQIVDVVHNASELHSNLDEVAIKLRKSDDYKKLFKKAFLGTPDTIITSEAIRKSIAEYEKTLISLNSKFDRYMRGEKTLNASEINGYNLFASKAKCATCHFTPLFNGTVPPLFMDSELEVIGVPKDRTEKELDTDLGRYRLFGIDLQRGSFKTPTLRNVALTAPYMHNGVYNTLEEVVEFYNKGGGQGLGYDVPNQTLPFDSLGLSTQEKNDLIAFMMALTDTTTLTSSPSKLPLFEKEIEWNKRKVGGEY